MGHHIAQINIARLRLERDDPRTADFFGNLDHINGLAEHADGFVWRLMDDTGSATEINAFDDPAIIINMSVWRSMEALQNFAYQTIHNRFIKRRAEWFSPATSPTLALWWSEAGQLPTAEEGRKRLEHLAQEGPSPFAFTFSNSYDPPEPRAFPSEACPRA